MKSSRFDCCNYISHSRHVGLKRSFGFENRFFDYVYRSFRPRPEHLSLCAPGGSAGVFNLEFSADGRFLVAACADKSVRILDPTQHRPVYHRLDAHESGVNCIQFLDSRMFATGSDDKTIALWDIRMMKDKVQSLAGHESWVKSLAYMPESKVLLSSGFDGHILAWELNRPDFSGEVIPWDIIEISGLMRMSLTPDCTKMVVSNSSGYLMVFHDLDIWKMRKQYVGVKPNLYRLMQVSGIPLKPQMRYSPLFVARRNRLEFVSDFPTGNEACIISSLVIHPDGNGCISRHATNAETAEFTCVHDVNGPRVCRKFAPAADDDESEDDGGPDVEDEGEGDDHGDDDGPRRKRPRLDDGVPEARRGSSDGPPARPGALERIRLRSARLRRTRGLPRPRGGRDGRSGASSSFPSSSPSYSSSSSASSTSSATSAPSESPADRHEPDFLMVLRPENGGPAVGGRLPDLASILEQAGGVVSEDGNGAAEDGGPSSGPEGGARRDAVSLLRTLRRVISGRTTVRMRNDATGERSSTPYRVHLVSYDTWNALNEIRTERMRQTRAILENAASPNRVPLGQSRWSLHSCANRALLKRHSDGGCRCEVASDEGKPSSDDIFPNAPRMTHYIEEANVQHGYIKEMSVSPDGRVLASPFGNGHRLLMFDSQCRVPGPPGAVDFDGPPLDANERFGRAVPLVEARTSFGHSAPVLCTRFAPHHSSLVTGCLNGDVVWHYPVM